MAEKKEEKCPVLHLQDVWKTYTMGEEKVHALREFDLMIDDNDYMSIVGPSGSGKSTLLHMLGLLDVPTRGSVHIDGKDVSRMSTDERAVLRGKKIGFVFQVFNLVPSLTAVENVALPMMIQGAEKPEREEKAAKILDRLGMGERLHHLPSELSGGQRQRVAMSRALINDPELILADEPTGNLDSKTGQDVVALFDKLHKEGRTIVVVTHDESIAKHADEQVYIVDGMVKEWKGRSHPKYTRCISNGMK
ncbi:ATP-binding cassette domain-containing protein [Candidatus Micrarchaeota archaeon]|nr:ATP-binding cassette domain-containing protein [Candidatus Micrarchaeota archaeon]MBD3418235.1 ATP-binding cassette domain-containing protein [Candidatus Micrarchaeota archaeon]